MIKHIVRVIKDKFKSKEKYQELLAQAYSKLDRELMDIILIELMEVADMNVTPQDPNPSMYALGFREGKRALVKHILRNLDLDEIKLAQKLGE
jgi:hypothetical protein